MTWKELIEKIKTPSIVSDSIKEFYLYPLGNGDFISAKSLDHKPIIFHKNSNFNYEFELIDWIEEISMLQTISCNCDLFTVLMRSGCKCGGQ